MHDKSTTLSICYQNSGCSRHMNGNKALLSNFKGKGPTAIFGNINSIRTRGHDTVGNCAVSFNKFHLQKV